MTQSISDDIFGIDEGWLNGHLRSHHHTTSNCIEWVRSDTSTSCHTPSEKEGGEERTLKGADENDGLERVVHSEIKTSVDDNSNDRGNETTVDWSKGC